MDLFASAASVFAAEGEQPDICNTLHIVRQTIIYGKLALSEEDATALLGRAVEAAEQCRASMLERRR